MVRERQADGWMVARRDGQQRWPGLPVVCGVIWQRYGRLDATVEHRPGGGADQPSEDDQAHRCADGPDLTCCAIASSLAA